MRRLGYLALAVLVGAAAPAPMVPRTLAYGSDPAQQVDAWAVR